MSKKRVWCLYRVSKKKQTSIEDDIPMQRQSCHEYVANKPDWEITNELYEKGVSGWKKSADKRDELTIIRDAAIQKQFDILLLFMLDRLGRKEDESPLIVQFLHEQGIEVWSVQEGRRTVESHVDKLITYINFWQASGESLKTSIRVRESKKQLSEQNYYQGGTPAYGYKVVETEQKHWKVKDKFIKELVPDEYESKIVQLVYDLYVNSHCGYRKIVDKLNEKYKARNGKEFGINQIQRILSNTIYIGLKNYNSFDGSMTTQPYNEKLRIISDEMFHKAEEIRNKRSKKLKGQEKDGIPLSGKLLFSGLAYCGYCGDKLSGNYLYRDYKVSIGDKSYSYEKRPVYRYRCTLNKGKHGHEKNMWGANKFDKLIIDRITSLLELVDIKKFIDVNVKNKKKTVSLKESTLDKLHETNSKLNKQLQKLNEEIANSLLGNSSFTPQQLSNAIDSITNQISENDTKIESLKLEIDKEKNDYSTEKDLAEEIKNWKEKFHKADNDLKKAMISRIIERIDFHKDDVNIHFKFQIQEILGKMFGGAL